MKKKILGLRTAIYMVPDIKEATAWYSEVFETKPYFVEPFYVGFNVAGYELGLQPLDQSEEAKTANLYTYWGVEDIHAEYDRFLSLGATEDEAPNDVGGNIMVASLKDPWGNTIGLIYNPEFTLDGQ